MVMKLILLVLLMTASACNEKQPATAPSVGAVTVHGQLLDFATQAARPAMTIRFVDDFRVNTGSATTDQTGSYVLSIPAAGSYLVWINETGIGRVRVHGGPFRGELFVDDGTCISRYGTVFNRMSSRPVAGATVSLGQQTATTGVDGWYRIDLGCPASRMIGFNTTFIYVTHPRFANYQQIVGRRLYEVQRLDMDIDPL